MSVNFNGITPNNFPFNNRIIFDNNYIVNVAGPSSGASVNTNGLNLLNTTPYPVTEIINVMAIVGVQGTANTANSKNVNVVLQMTNDNAGTPFAGGWTNIPNFAAMVGATDNAGGGWAAQGNIIYKLQPNNQQWIRAQFSLEANGGNASSANCTLALVF